jgi:hypothetical protein
MRVLWPTGILAGDGERDAEETQATLFGQKHQKQPRKQR